MRLRIYISGLKRDLFFYRERIKKNLELWISNVILNDEDETIRIPEKFTRIFKNIAARQYAIENLIANKKTFSGIVANNIRHLYEELGFKEDSLKKLKSNLWFIKAKGIQELAIMDQNDHLIKVYRLTNSKNDFVRNEAQTAIIQWSGFNGLRFLDVASYDISEWQQVQLLVQLKNFTQQDMPKLEKWLSSANESVIVFALKLAEVYQQFHVKPKVEECLSHKNEFVRVQAVATLAKIGDAESADRMILLYKEEQLKNRFNILQSLPVLATNRHLSFLRSEMENENDSIKLSAARAAAKLGHIDIVAEMAKNESGPYQHIYKHIKAEMEL